MKKMDKKGFTLAELLIVVAIIAILVAIGIPAFSTAMERSREAVDMANIRAAYAEFMAGTMTGDKRSAVVGVYIKQTKAGWISNIDSLKANFNTDATSSGGDDAWTTDANGPVASSTGAAQYLEFSFDADGKSEKPILKIVASTTVTGAAVDTMVFT